MTSIGGPGGIDGPERPGGPDRPSEIDDVAGDAPLAPPRATGEVEALAAELAAGRLTPREAIDRLVEATADPGLGATERAELRVLLGDLLANDPHLGALVGALIGRS
jgi:hypothetical protein